LKTTRKLRILLIAAEVAPLAKVGGLADVAGALPKALKALGHDVRIVMPCYKMVETAPAYSVKPCLPDFPVPIREGVLETAFVKQTSIESDGKQIPVYLVGNAPQDAGGSGYFQQATDNRSIYALEPEPYVFFCRAVLEMLTRLKPAWKPDILHCNDWHTGLIPIFAQEFYPSMSALQEAAYVFTVHNLAYQGTFDRHLWEVTGLSDRLFTIDGLEFCGQWTFMKGGLLFSDRVNTVSENYAREIQTQEYGCGLEGLMRTLATQSRLSGILNGIDTDEYDPACDPRIPVRYDAEHPEGKARCKALLQAELGLPVDPKIAICGMVSRLTEQKGFDLLREAADPIMEHPIQFVLLGSGDDAYEAYFRTLPSRFPGKAAVRFGYDPELAQRIYAGSDLFLMPSRFEPCGLGQLIALRYGTIPLVRATGGLADTVNDFDPARLPEGDGFVFTDYTSQALLETLERALDTFRIGKDWEALVQRAMLADFSWARSAKRYVALYHEAIQARGVTLRGEESSS